MLRTLFVIAVLIGSALSAFDYSECGRQRDDLDPEIKIVGGKPAQDGAWPWQAALYRYGRRICGATVVHPEWIVTAAHCVDVINDPPIFEYLVGSNTILNYNQSEYYQFRQTTAVYVHPNYRLESSDYDIALMRMSEPFEWDDAGYVYPACVPSGDMVDDFPPGHPSVITGWGAETEGGSQSNDLNEVEVPIVDQTSCNESYSGSISDYMICGWQPRRGERLLSESALKPFDVYLDKRIDPTSTGLDNFNASESNGCGFECLETDCHAFDVMPDLNENNETVCILAMTGLT
ncbi:putative trypsin-1-like [Apostichopus japonicus]|uniref:Putative trypsin-1-like n=1 Tax=Stichopus japonicus TaxID=307972 RepID=A0A2G8KRH7_STIJA|nr:putative trypsin-1-like [Apostichopus japonicus]